MGNRFAPRSPIQGVFRTAVASYRVGDAEIPEGAGRRVASETSPSGNDSLLVAMSSDPTHCVYTQLGVRLGP